MVLCRREVTVTTAPTALIKSRVSHAYLNKAIIWGLFIGCWEEKVVCLLSNGGWHIMRSDDATILKHLDTETVM